MVLTSFRSMLAVGVSVSVLSGVTLAAAAPAPPAPSPAAVWAQSQSDVAPDPAIRFGRLANGMRYAILRNGTPTGQVAVRLRIGSGSFEESDAQQGLAHMLEHMTFKGSAHVPAGEMLKILERKGLAFGPDTNAATYQQQTVYMLDLPQSDADTVDTGLMLMRETASELSLDPAALQSERGVVLSEERLRATPAFSAAKAQVGFLLEGQLAADRWPIGKVDVIQNAPASLVRDYYQRNYRPERATLIIVGDIDPIAIESKIAQRFGDWKGVGPSAPSPDLGAIKTRSLSSRVIVQPGGQTSVQIVWERPYDKTPDSLAKRRRDTEALVAFQVLNRRLERLARSANPPFLAAGAAKQDLLQSARLGVLSVVTAPGQWSDGLKAAEAVRRQAVTYGLSQTEVDREITEVRAALQNRAAGQGTRKSPEIAAELVQATDMGEVITSPAQDLALFDQNVKGLTAAQVSEALRQAFSGQGPLVVLSSPTPVEGGDAALTSAFERAEAQPVAAPVAEVAKAWPYTSFGPAGQVVETRQIADLGVTFVRFANGVRLTVKPTAFHKDEILVSARFGGGYLDLPLGRAAPTWALPALVQGGLKDLTLSEIQKALSGKVVTQALTIGDDAFELQGKTRSTDLPTQFQLLAADLSAPGYQPEAFERLRGAYLQALDQLAATSQGVIAEHLAELQHGGDARWRFPTRAELDAAKPDDLRSLLARPLQSEPLEVIVVGDVTVDQAVREAAATFGALPARASDLAVPAAARSVHAFGLDTTPVNFTHKGRADQGVAIVAWPTMDAVADRREARKVRVTAEILKLRLIDEVRISQGASYSPDASADASDTFPGYGYVLADVEIPPTKAAGFFNSVSKITADMATSGVTDDELERARKPLIEARHKAQESNEFWLSALGGAQQASARLDLIRTSIDDLQAVTPADVKAVAAKYLTDGRTRRITVTPAGQ